MDGIAKVMSYDYHKLLSGLIHLTDLQLGRCQTGRWGWVMLWGRNLRFTWSFGAICFFLFTEDFHYSQYSQISHFAKLSMWKKVVFWRVIWVILHYWCGIISVNCPRLHNQQQYQRATPFTKWYGPPEGRYKKAARPLNLKHKIHHPFCSRTWK